MASLLDMKERFYTSTEASTITGCSRRQIQHWRRQGIIVPTVNPGGKGRNVYYSELDLLNLSILEYLLSRGLSFEASLEALTFLKDHDFLNSFEHWKKLSQGVLYLKPEAIRLGLLPIDSVETILKENFAMIPISGDYIYDKLQNKLRKFQESKQQS